MTGLELTLYSGVPFNNKYKDVLFVSRETRDTFLSQYTIGNSFDVNRFEIINDTEAIIDITNAFNGFECNYAKVHTTLTPETTLQTTERDTFYFVNSARQIATNVVRLTLEKDVFQSDFNKYDYQKQAYAIPTIKNGRCILTNDEQDDFVNIKEKFALTPLQISNDMYAITPLWDKSTQNTKVKAIFHYTDTTGEYVAISQNDFSIYDNASNVYPYALDTLLNSLITKQKFYQGVTEIDINVLNIYLVPIELLGTLDTTNMTVGHFKYNNLVGGGTTNVNYYLTKNLFGIPETKILFKYTSIETDQTHFYNVGTFAHQISIENNGKPQVVGVRCFLSNNLQILLISNNQIIDIAQDFEYSLFESDYAKFINEHKNGIAIKGISNALNLIGAIGGLAKGNPTSLLTASKTVTNIAGDFAEFVDLKDKPLHLQCESNVNMNIKNFNGLAIFKWSAKNKDEIEKNQKYYGNKIDFLTSLNFYYKENLTYTKNQTNYSVNFDYFQFANLELIAYLPENTKRTIEQMFLNGVRVWYDKDKFLQTIEHETIIV